MSKYMLLSNVDNSMVVVKLIETNLSNQYGQLEVEIYRVNSRKVHKTSKGKKIGNLVTRIAAKDFVQLSFSELKSMYYDQSTLSRHLYGEIKHWILSNEYGIAV